MIKKNSNLRRICAIDVFCGIGGLTHGLGLAGVNVKAGIDVDPSCQYVYEANNPDSNFLHADVRTIRSEDIAPYYKDADVSLMVGCAPCQPFSAHTRRLESPRSDNCSLVGEFARLIGEATPDVISMENVPGLAKHNAFEELLSTLDELGYKWCDYDVLSCSDYGVPQNRKRLVLLASRLGEISLPSPTPTITTVADLIRGLPAIEDGHASPDDPAHASLPLSSMNRKRIRQSIPGGTWRDWDEEIVNECHRKAYYPAPYGRMRWDAAAPTITTQFCYYSTGRFGHPKQHRAISVREAALLQTFPGDYKLTEDDKPVTIRKMARHIGNAVPVKLAEAIGKSILEGIDVL